MENISLSAALYRHKPNMQTADVTSDRIKIDNVQQVNGPSIIRFLASDLTTPSSIAQSSTAVELCREFDMSHCIGVAASDREFPVFPLSSTGTIHSSTLAGSFDPVLMNAETLQSNRPSRVYLVSADAYFRAKTKSHAI